MHSLQLPCHFCLPQSQLWVSLMLLLQLLHPVVLREQYLPPMRVKKCHWILPMLIPQLDITSRPLSPSCPIPSDTSTSFPIVVVPELAVPPHAQPEQLNQPGGGKEYQCQMCTFHHTNKDCMLTHIHKHLDITGGCPMCGKGFQNAASLWKNGRRAHAIQILESAQD